ncbi:MAG TPA: pentapeptide repeat-containing protein [Gaiellaceae bacterium]|nr:pentapeptide repeat-containing protein [Gaiellaceae bacterium]
MSPRRPTSTAPSPPSPPDLPETLEPLERPPAELRGVKLQERLLVSLDLSGRTGHDLRIVESRLERVDLSDAAMRGLSLRDVAVHEGSWAGLAAESARLERVELHGVRMTGASFPNGSFRDVVFVDCLLDLANFRFCELTDARFERCRLEESDLYEAKLLSVMFAECDLTGVSLAGAVFERAEMRGCRLAAVGNPDRLRGVRMPLADAVAAADVLAAAAGIEIVED